MTTCACGALSCWTQPARARRGFLFAALRHSSSAGRRRPPFPASGSRRLRLLPPPCDRSVPEGAQLVGFPPRLRQLQRVIRSPSGSPRRRRDEPEPRARTSVERSPPSATDPSRRTLLVEQLRDGFSGIVRPRARRVAAAASPSPPLQPPLSGLCAFAHPPPPRAASARAAGSRVSLRRPPPPPPRARHTARTDEPIVATAGCREGTGGAAEPGTSPRPSWLSSNQRGRPQAVIDRRWRETPSRRASPPPRGRGRSRAGSVGQEER